MDQDFLRRLELILKTAAPGELYPLPTFYQVRKALWFTGHSNTATDNAYVLYSAVPDLVKEVRRLQNENESLRDRLCYEGGRKCRMDGSVKEFADSLGPAVGEG